MKLDTSILSDKIFQIRGQAVILDSDLAEVYGTTTTALKPGSREKQGALPR
ncbi:MAG: ORF6N domain-containing protein [Opitutales bacterium]